MGACPVASASQICGMRRPHCCNAELGSVSLVGITAPGTEFFRPETKPKFRPVSPAETKYQKPYVKQAALTRPVLTKSL